MTTLKKIFTATTKTPRLKLLSFGLLFAVVGTIVTFVTQAANSSTISGVVFQDTNRNGTQDAGEVPYVGKYIYLFDGITGVYIKNAMTDGGGGYRFDGLASGSYKVTYAPTSWNELKQNWVPTTLNGSILPQITITLTDTATVNFGWRQIVRSTDTNAPISTFTGSNGLVVKSYDDVVIAKEIYDRLMTGTLIGDEARYVTIRFDFAQAGLTSSLAVRSNGVYIDYKAVSDITYSSWLGTDGELFHEYGHAWAGYYTHMVQQDALYTSYLQARGLYGDDRLNTSYAWETREIIAEDYRQLFGSPTAQANSQINKNIPLAKDVPGLSNFLSTTFRQAPADTTPPSAPTSLVGSSTAQNQVQLTWAASTDNKAVTKYYIYRDGDEQPVSFVNAPAITYTDSGLTASTTYQYHVRAADAAGNLSAESTKISVTTRSSDIQAPSAPTNLKMSGSTSNSISLTWTASTDNVGVVGYQIYQLSGRKGTYNLLPGTATTPGFSVTNLSPNTSYSLYIIAVDAAGNQSAPSSILTVKTKR